jgi:hypothetical protein
MTPAAALVTRVSARLDGSESVSSAAARPPSITKTGDSKARASGPGTSTRRQSEHRFAPQLPTTTEPSARPTPTLVAAGANLPVRGATPAARVALPL